MSLNMGASRQSSSSQSQSQSDASSYGFNTAESGDVSRSLSESLSGGQSTSNQRIAFEDIYKNLFTGASGAASRAALQAPELASAASQLFTGGTQFLQNLGGDVGSEYMRDRLTGPDTATEDIISAMRSDAGSLFAEELNPAITARAVAGGTLGGGRQGVAQGIAQGQVAREFVSKAANLRLASQQSKDALAQQISANSIASAGTGLAALPGMLDLVSRGQNAELGAYGSLSAILGGPTVLGESQATEFGRSTAQSAAEAFSRAFGEQTSESTSTSSSSSKGKGRSYNFGFGLESGS